MLLYSVYCKLWKWIHSAPATAAAQATAPSAKHLKVSLGATRASARAAAIAKQREAIQAKHLSSMESPENIRGQTVDEQMVRSYRIEFEDPREEKESEEEREKESQEEREDEREDEKEEEEIAEEKERAEEKKTEKKEKKTSPPPPPPWSKYFSKNSLRVICPTCFAGTTILLVVERDTPCTSILLAAKIEIKTKAQTFRYRSLLSEQNQKFLIWSAYYWNKNRTFQSVPKLFKIKSECFGVFFKFKNETRMKPSLFLSDRNVSIHLCFRGIKTELLYFQKTISERNQKRFK